MKTFSKKICEETKKSKLIVYGTGAVGEIAYYALKSWGREPDFFCDHDPNKRQFFNIDVLQPEELTNIKDVVIIIAFKDFLRSAVRILRQAPPTNTTNTYQGNSHRQTTVNTRNQGSAGKKVVWAIIAIIVVVFIINGISKNNNGYSNDYDYGNNLPDETYENISDNTNYESSDDYYILPYSNESYISEEDLTDLSQQEVSLARNEIYARHGRKFSTPEIHDYFMEQPWYTEIYEPEEFDSMANEVFNEYEKENVKTIINYEEKMGYR